jgi:hypothetical protein
VFLEAKDEAHLRVIAARLTNAGIEHHCVEECEDDEDYPGQMMAIGVNPREGKVACLSDLPLVR